MRHPRRVRQRPTTAATFVTGCASKRDYKKDASSTTCTGCTAVCGGIYPSDTCSTRVDSDSDPLAAIQLGPVGSATFCLPAQDCLPSATCLPCDNRNMTTSCGAKTCNTANEWCSALHQCGSEDRRIRDSSATASAGLANAGLSASGLCVGNLCGRWCADLSKRQLLLASVRAEGHARERSCSGWTEFNPACNDEQY